MTMPTQTQLDVEIDKLLENADNKNISDEEWYAEQDRLREETEKRNQELDSVD